MLNCRTKRIALKKRLWLQLQPEMLHRRGTCTHPAMLMWCSVLPRAVLWELGAAWGAGGGRAGLAAVCAHPEAALGALFLHSEWLLKASAAGADTFLLLEHTFCSCGVPRTAFPTKPPLSLCSCTGCWLLCELSDLQHSPVSLLDAGQEKLGSC